MRRPKLRTRVAGALRGRSRGFTLIEVLVALALFGIIAIVFAGGLGTASRAVFTADIRATAESLARSQMEYVKSQVQYHEAPWAYRVTDYESRCLSKDDEDKENCPFWYSYKLSDEYAGYTATVEAQDVDEYEGEDNIQQITVTVEHVSDLSKPVIVLVGYNVNRRS